MHKPFLIKHLEQKDNHAFSIVWNDDKAQTFHLSELQKMCPCANCRDEQTGEILLDPQTVKSDVRALFIRSVGRYALQIQFTSGCSTGIYSFDMLRNFSSNNPL
jgi:ATP-binding protein involved in chromosome partitioning